MHCDPDSGLPFFITPLEQYLRETAPKSAIKDIWVQHKALLTLGDRLKGRGKGTSIQKLN